MRGRRDQNTIDTASHRERHRRRERIPIRLEVDRLCPKLPRQSQPVPTPVTYHVTTQIFITRDLLGAIGPIDRAVVPGHR